MNHVQVDIGLEIQEALYFCYWEVRTFYVEYETETLIQKEENESVTEKLTGNLFLVIMA